MLCLLLQFIVTIGHCQWEYNRQAFFRHLKNFNFKKAQAEVEEVTDTTWNAAMNMLWKTLYQAGQIPNYDWKKDSMSIASVEEEFPNNSPGLVLINVLWGYHYFYSNPYTKNPIEKFTEAYLLAQQQGTSEEVKYCIYSILKLYNWELSQSNNDLLDYLKIYEELIQDEADEFRSKMSRFIYELKPIDYQVDLGEQFVNSFKELMGSFPESHHFWTEYYIILGVYRRHFGLVTNKTELTDEAEKLFNIALSRMGDEPYLRYLKFRTYIQLSEVARVRKNYKKAINYILKAKENSYLNEPIRAEFWVNRYSAANLFGVGKTDSAFYTLSRADTLRYQLDYQLNALKIAQFKWKFQTEEKEKLLLERKKELLEQEKQLLLEREGKARSRNITLILGITLVLGIVISILIYRNAKRKQLLAIQDKNIETQKVASLLKEQELIALNSMIEGQEKERKRIAEDLHDRLGSTLSAVKMYMDVLAEENPKYTKVNAIVDKAVNDTRQIAHNMLSGVLAKFGLLAALQDLKETIEASNQFMINLRSIQFDQRLESEIELHIYRIIQELVSNTLKHAQAAVVDIELRKSGNQNLTITYQDDGKGFESSSIHAGMGLKNIESRLKKINGNWTIDSSPMRGVKVIIQIKPQ